MTDVALPEVLFEIVRPHVAIVTLNRPQAHNAISGTVASMIDDIVARTEADTAIWAAILTGAGGKAFCSGADLKAVSDGKLATLWTPGGGFAGFVNADRKKVWIAAVDGYALAGGFELMLACDLVVASTASQFGLPEVKRGLVAAAGGAFRAPRALPKAIAMELIATGGRIAAEKAHHFGLINRLTPAGEALDGAIALALEICENAPIAVQESLGIARRALDLDDAALGRLSDDAQNRIMLTEDFREGPFAFIEKRAPVWSGR